MTLITHLKNSKSINLLSILLEGDLGCGKTALSSYISKESNIPYIKMISPDILVRYNEKGKYNAIYNIFEDGYKSPFSIIILDNIETLLECISRNLIQEFYINFNIIKICANISFYSM